ncbi:MAG: class I SAM-dependent methyltransferase [Desulfopila sp.]
MFHPEHTWRKTPFHLWQLYFRLGWSERVRGLHYWLGFEYALILDRMRLEPDSRVLDVGTGAYSVFPYLADHLFDIQMTAIDIGHGIRRLAGIRESAAVRVGLCKPDQVHLLRADARSLPFLAETFDAVNAVSVLKLFPNRKDAGQTLAEAARVLRPGGRFG